MKIETAMEKSSAYFISQCRDEYEKIAAADPHLLRPAITISHEMGAGVGEISERLVEILQKAEGEEKGKWEVFDQELIEQALVEQRWPKKLAQKIAEEKRFFIDELIDDLFGLRPPSWVLVPQVVETTLRLAIAGHAILVGHGATVVTANLPNVFHVRLTGSSPKRIERMRKQQNLSPEAAAKFVRKEDRKRAGYLKSHFHARLDDELFHDIVINTDRISDNDAATAIIDAAQKFFAASNFEAHNSRNITPALHAVAWR
jgi:Cytidylate kinase-like family